MKYIKSYSEGKYFPSIEEVYKVINFAEKCNKILPNSVIYSSGSPFSMKYPAEKLRKMLFTDSSLSGVVKGNFSKGLNSDTSIRIPITLGSLDSPYKNSPDYDGSNKLKKVRFPLYIVSKSSEKKGIFAVGNLGESLNLKTTFYYLGHQNSYIDPNGFDVYLLDKYGIILPESKLRDIKNDDLFIILKIEDNK